jgi:hypothetical protein
LKLPIARLTKDVTSAPGRLSVLTAERNKKGKSSPEDLMTAPEEIKSIKMIPTHSGLHSAITPGILCVRHARRNSCDWWNEVSDEW